MLVMRRIVGLLAFCFLSTCASGYAVAEATCVSTTAAVEMAQANGVKPLILRGKGMKPFVAMAEAAGSVGLEHANFVAVVLIDEGAAVFFGNVTQVCGPMLLTREQITALLGKPV